MKAMFRVVLFAAVSAASSSAQSFQGENITMWNPCNIGSLFDGVDTLWMGGVFLRDTSKLLTLTLHGNEAGIEGYLYLMVPGHQDSAYYICKNHDPAGTVVDLSSFAMAHLDTLYFMYALTRSSGSLDPGDWRTLPSNDLLFTGPNRRAGDTEAQGAPAGGWLNTDRYSTDRIYTSNIPCNNFPNYRRYEVAGWLCEDDGQGGRALTDTVAFGFEDLNIGDGDFDDVVFYMTGAFVDQPVTTVTVEGISIDTGQFSGSLEAGDSLAMTAQVYVDSVDRDGAHHIVRYSSLEQQVIWYLSAHPGNPDLAEGAGPSASNTFYAARAHAHYTVRASYTDPEGNRVSAEVDIGVAPGPPDHLVIEASPDSAGKLWADSPRDLVVLEPGVDTSQDFHAVVRDQFGNWIGYADPAVWTSSNPSSVQVEAGQNPGQGQGRAIRISTDRDTALVTARYADPGSGATLSDSMLVRLETVYYDGIRVGTRIGQTFTTVDTLVLTTSDDTTVWVQGRRADNATWEDIDASWLSDGLTLSPASASGQSWSFSPTAAQNGSIIAATSNTVDGGLLSDSVQVAIGYGVPQTVLLYPQAGDPSPLQPLPPSVSVNPGDTVALALKAFDADGLWLEYFESVDSLGLRMSWSVAPADGASLSAESGSEVAFVGTRGYQSFTVTAQYAYEGRQLSTDVTVVVVPVCCAGHLYLEPSPLLDVSPNQPNHVDTLVLSAGDQVKSLYAVVRDDHGNYVMTSDATTWKSADTTIVNVAVGQANIGQGYVSRTGSGTTTVTATDRPTGLSASAVVTVLGYRYTDLGISRRADTLAPLTQLECNTNQDTTLYAFGRRSDNGVWEPVSATWEVSANLDSALVPPGDVNSWTIAPSRTGVGWVRVTMAAGVQASPDTLPITILPGPPTSLTVELSLPDSGLTAGDTLWMAVTVRNADNEAVPGVWCGTMVLTDSSGAARTGEAVVLIDTAQTALGEPAELCFEAGSTVVGVVFFDSLVQQPLQLSMSLAAGDADTLTAPLPPLLVAPSATHEIRIELTDGTDAVDTVYLTPPDAALILLVQSYDVYGNVIGHEPMNWHVSYSGATSLHPIAQAVNAWRIYYETTTVTAPEQGWIVAVHPTDPTIRDSVYVVVTGPAGALQAAHTLDTNGNGLLDGLLVRFSEMVSLPQNAAARIAMLHGMQVTGPGDSAVFTVKDMIGVDDALEDTIFLVQLEELDTDEPQSAWEPEIAIDGVSGVANTPVGSPFVADDGAGPVVWKANRRDLCADPFIRVTFSEPVQLRSGTSLAAGTDSLNLDSLLVVYARHEVTGLLNPVDSALVGAELVSVLGDTALDLRPDPAVSIVVGDAIGLRAWADISGMQDDTVALVTDRSLSPEGENFPVLPNVPAVVGVVGEHCGDDFDDDDDTDTGCGNCGTGVEQALLPLFWFGGRSLWRRKKRKKGRHTA